MNTREIAVEYRLAHWAKITQDRRDSGLSVKAFCETEGFHENIYYYWQRKLREAAYKEMAKTNEEGAVSLAPLGFAEVKIASRAAIPPATTCNCSNQVCVETPRARITADSEYPADKLAHLVSAVMQKC